MRNAAYDVMAGGHKTTPPSHAEIVSAVASGHDHGTTLAPLSVRPRLEVLQSMVGDAQRRLDDDGFDALLVTSLLNVRALTGFTGSAGRLVVRANRAVFITDGRYAERAEDELRAAQCDAEIVVRTTIAEQNEAIASVVSDAARVGLEATHVTWVDLETYDQQISAQLVPTRNFVESLRRTKSVGELQRLARASAIADDAFRSTVDMLGNQPTEREFANALEAAMRQRGADDVSFETIIASGPNGSRPHHEPGTRRIVEGDLVICDFGALVDGYHSDTTRTVSVGEPSKAQLRHIKVVFDAQQRGVSMVRAGTEGKAIDSACRESLASVGMDQYFTTGTGHGSGLQIHEEPALGKTSTSVLAEGDITTVEPGVYVPGEAGVRIEDSMVVTANEPILLTRLPYELVAG